jgi:long-chain acyl-CoA synthetase
MFLTALIVPDFEAIKEYADSHNIKYKDISDLISKREVYNLVEQDISKIQKSLANYERIRKFTLLDHQFSLESGEVTPSLKLRRKTIEEKYHNLIEDMYQALEK